MINFSFFNQSKRCKKYLFSLLAIVLLASNGLMAQTNIAPLATASASNCSTGPCSAFNDLVYGTCGTQLVWISTSGPPAGTEYVEFIWPTTQVFDKITIHHAQTTGRFLAGGTIQIWNGTTYVNHHTFSGLNQANCVNDVTFLPVASTRLRITAFQMGTGQNSNPNFREIEIWRGSLSGNDVGIASIDSVGSVCSPTPIPIYATIQNFGTNQVTSANVLWSVNGALQSSIPFTGTLDTAGGTGSNKATILLGTYGFSSTAANVKAWTSQPNATADTIRINDTAYMTRTLALAAGTYTIGGTSPDFASFNEAKNALYARGICGPVTFLVANGVYNEQVDFSGNIPGSSEINTVTFKGASRANSILNFAATNTASRHTLLLANGARYITFRDMTIRGNGNFSGDFAFTVVITNGARSNRIANCNILIVGSNSLSATTNYIPVLLGGNSSSYSAGSRVDSNEVDTCLISRGYFGIVNYGVSGNLGLNNKFRGNTISESYYYGYYGVQNGNLTIENNEFNLQTATTGITPIYVSSAIAPAIYPHRIVGNKMNTIGSYAMGLFTVTNQTGAKGLIANNVIGGNQISNTGYGIYMSGNTNFMVHHNSANLNAAGSTATQYAGIYITGGSGISIMNNNLARTASGMGMPLYLATATVSDTCDYNNYFKVDTASGLIYKSITYFPANYRTAQGKDSNSISNPPGFLSALNLNINVPCNKGIALPVVPTDITGLARSITAPNMGAYEMQALNNNIGIERILAPTPTNFTFGSNDVWALVRNTGINTVTSFDVSYKLNGGTAVTQPITATLDACDTVSVLFTGSNQVTLGSNNNLKVYTSAPNASQDSFPGNDTLEVNLFAPLSGNYTIGGTGANFANFTSAVDALKGSGVAGNVTFTVNPGTYSELVYLNGAILGLHDTARVVFQGVNKSTVIIESNKGSGPVVGVFMNNYITFRDMTIRNLSPSGSGFAVVGTNTNNSGTGCGIINCVIDMPNYTTGTAYPIIVTGTASGYGISAMRCDSITIDSNTVLGGYYGISVYGSSNAAYNRFIRIRNNTCTNLYYMGAYIAYNYNAMEFIGNSFSMNPTYGYYGVYFYSNQNASTTTRTIFANNSVINHGGYGSYIYYPTTNSSTAARTYIYNNMITTSTSYNVVYGLYVVDQSTNGSIVVHNTSINRYPTGTVSYAAMGTSGATGVIFKNNICVNLAGASVPAYFATNPAAGNVNHNIYWNPAGTPLVYRNGTYWNATNFKTFANGGDSSHNINPDLVSGTNLHTSSACIPQGADFTAIAPTDFDGDLRTSPGMIGADEVVGMANDLELVALLSPTTPVSLGTQDLKVLVKNRGTNTVSSFNVAYRLNNGTPVVVAYSGSGLNTCASDTVTFTGANQITIGAGANTIKVYTYAPNSNPDSNPANDTLNSTLAAPLSGNYVVGAAPSDFSNLTDALTAAKTRGISGRTTFLMKTGVYTGNYAIEPIPGTSASNTLNIVSQSGNRDDVRFEFANDASNLQVFNISGSFINIKNVTIRQTNGLLTSTNAIIRYNGAPSNDSISNCVIWGPIFGVDGSSTTSYSLYATGINTNRLIYENNYFKGTFYGAYLYGSNTTYSVKNTEFIGNTFDSVTYGALYYLYYTAGTKIMNNTFYHRVIGGTYTTGYQYWYYNDSGYVCTNNKVQTFGGKSLYWYNYYSRNSVANPGIVANNEVNGSSSFIYWALMGSVTNNYNFYHNTINSGSNYTYINASGNNNVKMFNNIFAATGTYALYWSAAPPSITQINSDYNLYFSTASATPIYAAAARSLQTFKGAYPTYDKNSVQNRAPFISVANLMPNPSDTNVWVINGRGVHNTIAPLDMLGITRPASILNGAPDMGAYEVTPNVGTLAPLATAVPAIPVLGSTQHFLLGMDTVAKITWDLTSNLPTETSIRYYTGAMPNTQGANGKAINAYYDIKLSGFGLNYNLDLHYKNTLRGAIGSQADLRLANYPVGSWNYLAASTVDSVRAMVSATSLTDTSAIWTLTDVTDPLTTFLNITAQPQSVTKCNGDSAVFTVAATGTGLGYQWQVNTGAGFTNITGATTPTLVVNSLNSTFNGNKYRCTITNLTGTAQSNEATLTIGGTTNIATQPMNASGCQGDNAIFTVAATGSNLAYEWQENMGSGFSPIMGATAATLIRYNIQASMSGYTYRAIVTGACGVRTSDTVNLTVSGPITITGQPTPTTVNTCAGSTVNISMTATGAATYQWQIDVGSGYVNIPNGNAANLSITNVPATYNNGTIRCVLTNACNTSFSNTTAITVQTPGLWSGVTSTAWNTASNWGCSAVPTSATDVVIPATAINMPLATTGVSMRSLTINPSATINLTGAGALNIFGNLTNDGTISGTAAWINFVGTSAQTMNGGSYNKVNVNNAAGLTLTAPLTIVDTLQLSNGLVTLGSSNLTLSATGRILGNTAAKYIATDGNGSLVINNIGTGGRTGAVLFPVGTATNYNPVTLTNIGIADNYSARVIAGSFPAYTGNVPSGNPYASNVVDANWIVEEASTGGSNLTISLQWNGSQELPSFTRATSYVSRYLANGWNNYAAGAATGTNPYVRTVAGVTILAPLGIGSNGTLPVSWLSFVANANGKDAELNWVTASEINNKGFEVERSFNGVEFETIGFVKGNGNNASMSKYNFTDARVLEINRGSDVYYRLKQVDFDGNFEYSKVVLLGSEEGSDISLYPNPFVSTAGVYVSAMAAGNVSIEVKDLMGRTIFTSSEEVVKGGQYIEIGGLSQLSDGLYLVQVSMNGEVKTFKVQKTK